MRCQREVGLADVLAAGLILLLLGSAGRAAAGTSEAPRRGSLDLPAVQAALRSAHLGAWLLCDFRGSDPGARRLLGLSEQAITTRRFCYVIPARGEPKKLVHAIEPAVLDHLPGSKIVYRSWQDFERGVLQLARSGGRGRVAVAYSARDALPYVDRLPGGLLDLLHSAGVKVASSADLEQRFLATGTDEELRLQREAARFLLDLTKAAFERATAAACAGTPLTEVALQQWMASRMREAGYLFDHPPIVAVGPHAADPHYVPTADRTVPIEAGSLLLIDVWAKRPGGFYADLTRMAFLGAKVPKVHRERFARVLAAQQAALSYIQAELAAGRVPRAWRADRRARTVLTQAGYGDAFLHRTGHSITTEVHGIGAHLDDLETHDTRGLIPRTCFSIEPGIYLAGEAGYRSEIDVCIRPGEPRPVAEVTTVPRQMALPALACGKAKPEAPPGAQPVRGQGSESKGTIP
ncbi:MAG: aminopeptidase P family protein [Deltaproteobacteria bacterium]|nr:MAG: aminopeptidase P family protein [Deltaproteobacteria bacterium]